MSARRLLVVNPNTDTRVTAWLAQEARRVAPGHVVVEAVNAASGFAALRTPEEAAAAGVAVVEAIAARKPDAALIGAFGDPGLEEARALGFAVAGLGECGLRAAAAKGRFAILTLGAAMRGPIVARVERMGLGDKLTEVRVLSSDIPDFVARRSGFAATVAAEVQALVTQGASCVLLAGGPFAGFGRRLGQNKSSAIDGVASCMNSPELTFALRKL